MKNILLATSALALIVNLAAAAAPAPFSLNAKSAYVFHPATGTVLLNQNGDQQMGPASLTKMMTLYLTFQALKEGRLKLTDQLPVSEKAWRMGGSKMFVKVGTTVDVESLIRGMAIVSGNDACVVMAEKLGGTEEGFVAMMNKKATDIGMTHTNFTNANGWPDPAERTTAHDMAQLLTAIFRDFPEYKKYMAEEEFTYNGIKQQNRNGLLHANAGVDAGKTGHTEESGYHLAATAVENNERLVSVVMGTDGFSTREGETLKAFRTFFASNKTVNVFQPGDAVVKDVPVWGGPRAMTDLTVAAPVGVYISQLEHEKTNAQVSYNKPLVAPIAAGTPVGEVRVTLPSGQVVTSSLVVGTAIPKGGFFTRFAQVVASKFGH
ncbi:MAG TPA: D-alanyl-D-alanine carboxypeptidase family protein [Alphaproteobacteria bacterium]|nr:D-alanyl-D-alanine carboxypeptidase family protein [Alphaproteobacteria bacterium]